MASRRLNAEGESHSNNKIEVRQRVFLFDRNTVGMRRGRGSKGDVDAARKYKGNDRKYG